MSSEPLVPWVVAPKLALARGIAMAFAEERGRAWDRMSPASRDALLQEASTIVEGLVASRAAIEFRHPWRDPTKVVAPSE